MSSTDPNGTGSNGTDGAAVVVTDVAKYFDRGRVHALDGIDLVVQRGEWVAVTGPSGCGKSTLLHLLSAMDRPTRGRIVIFGRDLARVHDLARYRRTTVGMVFQLHDLIPHLTAAQNVEVAMFGTGRNRRDRAARAVGLLDDVALAGRGDRQPTRLSGGERQRVAIARALANDPPLLLADEPTGNLDAASVDHVLELLGRLRAGRPELTIVMVTHDPRVAAAADRVVRMSSGTVGGTAPITPRVAPPGGQPEVRTSRS